MKKTLIAILIITACTSCASREAVRPTLPDLVWPRPPAQPRIAWVKEVRAMEDAGIAKGFWKKLFELIAGAEEMQIVRPYGILADTRERLVIVDTGGGIVHLLDPKEGRYTILPPEGESRLASPIGVTEDDARNLYVTDSATGLLYRYDNAKGVFSAFIRHEMERPTGIAFNPTNRLLYVAETGTHQIVAIDLTGNERLRFGARGSLPGQFNYPTDLCIDRKGNVLITDALNARIQTFSAAGKFIASFGQPGDTPGNFAKPKGVAVDSDNNIYVSDALFDMIQIFSPSGQLLMGFGDRGNEPGQFWMPSGIFIDRNDFIYVSDTYNRRIQIFKYLKTDYMTTDNK
jgi:sugar lactone lactonase YvrE